MASKLKNCLRRLAGSQPFGFGVRLLEQLPDRTSNLLRVLTYHRIAAEHENDSLDPALISATPRQFERQMTFLAEEYQPVSLQEVLEAIAGRTRLPPRAVLVTFDDAYQDFAQHAWPVLSRLSVPVVLFVPTQYPDNPAGVFWWDRLYCAIVRDESTSPIETPHGSFGRETEAQRKLSFRRLKHTLWSLPDERTQEIVDEICEQHNGVKTVPSVLSWDRLRQLSAEGVVLAPHTRSHPLLDRIALESARDEICLSRDDLQNRIGTVPQAFSFPTGHFNSPLVEVLRQEGFQAAFTTIHGVNQIGSDDPLRLRRLHVGLQAPDAVLRARLVSAARLFNPQVPQCFPAPGN